MLAETLHERPTSAASMEDFVDWLVCILFFILRGLLLLAFKIPESNPSQEKRKPRDPTTRLLDLDAEVGSSTFLFEKIPEEVGLNDLESSQRPSSAPTSTRMNRRMGNGQHEPEHAPVFVSILK